MKKNLSLITVDNFSSSAKELRNHFESRFQPSELPASDRFVWDWWHVPDQYTLLRTPAYHYFPEKMYMQIHKQLVMWGRKNLGCWDITPPWLSCYIDGCKQELHADVPHGPWAFVYSLSPQKPKYRGGETLLLKDQTLNYWQNFSQTQDRELSSFIDRVPARFNRLVVFDPRIPHGVTEVSGVKDPRDGRLVVHGWFSLPKTYIEGGLAIKSSFSKKTESLLNEAFGEIAEFTQTEKLCQGVISLKILVQPSGQISSVNFLTNSVILLNGESADRLNKFILSSYKRLSFPRTNSKSEIVVPLVFG
jgi:hypothetical protein